MKTTQVRRRLTLDLPDGLVDISVCVTGPINPDTGRVVSEDIWSKIETCLNFYEVSDPDPTPETISLALMRQIIEDTKEIADNLSFGVIFEGEIETVFVGVIS